MEELQRSREQASRALTHLLHLQLSRAWHSLRGDMSSEDETSRLRERVSHLEELLQAEVQLRHAEHDEARTASQRLMESLQTLEAVHHIDRARLVARDRDKTQQIQRLRIMLEPQFSAAQIKQQLCDDKRVADAERRCELLVTMLHKQVALTMATASAGAVQIELEGGTSGLL